jgi:hypothetical protein
MSNFDKLYEAVMSEDDVELGITGAQPGVAEVAPAATGEEIELTPKEHLAKAIELLQKLQSLDLISDESEAEAEGETEAGSDEDGEYMSSEDNEEIATEEIEAEDIGHALVNAKKGQELTKVSSGSNKVASTATSLAKTGKGGNGDVNNPVDGSGKEQGHALVGSGVKGGAPTSTKGKANVVSGVIKGGGKGDQDFFQSN